MISKFIPLLLAVSSEILPVSYGHQNKIDAAVKLDQQDLINYPEGDRSHMWKDELTLKTQGITNINVLNEVDSVCYHPFQNIGNGCYYFSDDSDLKHDFAGAVDYCESLSRGHLTSDITLAMLAYDNNEDLEVLDAVSKRGGTFWVGGNTDDGLSWKWLDGRDIVITAPFWYDTEPNDAQNKCMIADTYIHGNFKRSYVYDNLCSESLNFICQARKNTYCPFDFRRIGNYCYFVSEELNLPKLHWQDARDYCQSLSVPNGYHADLALLGLPDQGDIYSLMNNLMESYLDIQTWVGAVGDSDCKYVWIDERTISDSTFYWLYSFPSCGSTHRVAIYRYSSRHNRTVFTAYTEDHLFSFVCQMYHTEN